MDIRFFLSKPYTVGINPEKPKIRWYQTPSQIRHVMTYMGILQRKWQYNRHPISVLLPADSA